MKTSSFWKHFLVKEVKSNLDVIRSTALIFHIEKINYSNTKILRQTEKKNHKKYFKYK